MNLLVVGCGKVGSKLASVLDKMGHDVCIVDRETENFERLDHDFSGYTVSGIPIDQDVLRRAGIENSDAVIAVTQDDNVNIMVSQLAREVFHVENVLTRIYDPERENVFSHFHLKTICPTNLTVSAVCASLERATDYRQIPFGHSNIAYATLPLPSELVGKSIGDVKAEPDTLLFGVLKADQQLVLACNTHAALEPGDQLIFAKQCD
ncbi:TrkA family potassium uptake protein [Clostridiaceae bacterium NSJ-31]|uniref:TrkA family potassium uptake protein n=1 Tax=Ligaoa zhengdingensis TaxID=2763658 RepID=A0A926DY15_9FIRM|nr:TrkA family potassium uptake protein [Ligaoa zhengdingensis]MBC8545998.1 TrkA family potassium uptake protein [Ligaoa zhengdingensis]